MSSEELSGAYTVVSNVENPAQKKARAERDEKISLEKKTAEDKVVPEDDYNTPNHSSSKGGKNSRRKPRKTRKTRKTRKHRKSGKRTGKRRK
jgi:hypothetical protein